MRTGIAIAALVAAVHAMPAWAALGGSVQSVQVDGAMMRAKAQAMHGAGSYAVHEIMAAWVRFRARLIYRRRCRRA